MDQQPMTIIVLYERYGVTTRRELAEAYLDHHLTVEDARWYELHCLNSHFLCAVASERLRVTIREAHVRDLPIG